MRDLRAIVGEVPVDMLGEVPQHLVGLRTYRKNGALTRGTIELNLAGYGVYAVRHLDSGLIHIVDHSAIS